ncbi:hypothetical protein HPB50_024418 [Hyalomma asiaticum]|uniref:Uncharacterized protein n=1 Tax=Hyalomma asiaticum TaxID=266040 RepID=A0ACB7S9P5_HYAAI|nr:hypothetical protein HPB50_024418 [Hyalomma asiaticum]
MGAISHTGDIPQSLSPPYHDGVPAATTTFSLENTADCTPADDIYSSFTAPQASDPSSISVAAASLLEAEGMSHPKQLQAQSSSLSVLRNKEAVAAVVLDTMHDAEATTYPQPSENCSISSASLWHGDVETMLELDVLPHKGHDLHTYARMQILPGPLGLPPGTPVLSASGATDKASMLRKALANAKEDTAKMTVPTITRDQSTKAHPPAYATPSDLLSPDLSGSDEGSISSTSADGTVPFSRPILITLLEPHVPRTGGGWLATRLRGRSPGWPPASSLIDDRPSVVRLTPPDVKFIRLNESRSSEKSERARQGGARSRR